MSTSAADERLQAGREMLSSDASSTPSSSDAPQPPQPAAADEQRPAVSSRSGAILEGVRHALKTGEVPLTRGEALGYANEALGYAEETRQRLASKGKQMLGKLGPASELLSGASGQLAATAAEARSEWRAYLGGGDDGGTALCAASAAPFAHGAALAPEIRRFQTQFDRTEDDAALLRQAVEQLRACEVGFGTLPASLEPVGEMERAAAEAAAAVEAIAAREPGHDSSRDELEAQACAAVTADRAAFVAALESSTKATEEFCEKAAADEALKALRAKGDTDRGEPGVLS